MIKLKQREWGKIYERIRADYPPSVYLIRAKMKEVLGFVPRTHKEWVEGVDGACRGHYYEYVCLDFYNDSMESWFQLKYM